MATDGLRCSKPQLHGPFHYSRKEISFLLNNVKVKDIYVFLLEEGIHLTCCSASWLSVAMRGIKTVV